MVVVLVLVIAGPALRKATRKWAAKFFGMDWRRDFFCRAVKVVLGGGGAGLGPGWDELESGGR